MGDTAHHCLPVARHSAAHPHTHGSLHPHVERRGVAESPLEHVNSAGREVGRGDRGEGPTLTSIDPVDLYTQRKWEQERENEGEGE